MSTLRRDGICTACKLRGHVRYPYQIGHRTVVRCAGDKTVLLIPTINLSREPRCTNIFLLFEPVISLWGILPKETMKNADRNWTD